MNETTYDRSFWNISKPIHPWYVNQAQLQKRLEYAGIGLCSAIRNGMPEYELDKLRAEYLRCQEAYRPYCAHDWVDMSDGQGDDIREIVTCCTCGQDKALWDQAHALECEIDDLP
jgi:hypothetical protein